jgi:hypothetical protein
MKKYNPDEMEDGLRIGGEGVKFIEIGMNHVCTIIEPISFLMLDMRPLEVALFYCTLIKTSRDELLQNVETRWMELPKRSQK